MFTLNSYLSLQVELVVCLSYSFIKLSKPSAFSSKAFYNSWSLLIQFVSQMGRACGSLTSTRLGVHHASAYCRSCARLVSTLVQWGLARWTARYMQHCAASTMSRPIPPQCCSTSPGPHRCSVGSIQRAASSTSYRTSSTPEVSNAEMYRKVINYWSYFQIK